MPLMFTEEKKPKAQQLTNSDRKGLHFAAGILYPMPECRNLHTTKHHRNNSKDTHGHAVEDYQARLAYEILR